MKVVIVKDEKRGANSPLSKEQEKFLQRIDELDRLGKWTFLIDMVSLAFDDSELYDSQIIYTKTHFIKYYEIDRATFMKWIEIFLPELNKKYIERSGNRYTEQEFNEIIKTLGSCDFDRNHPYSRLELAILAYGEPDQSTSRTNLYNFIKLDLEELIPEDVSHLNKFPPAVAKKLLVQLMKQDLIGDAKMELKTNKQQLFRATMMRRLSKIENWSKAERSQERKRVSKIIDNFFNDIWPKA